MVTKEAVVMDIEKLRSFITVAEMGSISAAADELYLSSSAVSKHISSLESELGLPLFCRSQKKMSLSPDGEKCLGHAKAILQEHKQMLLELCQTGTVSIASIPAQDFLTYPLCVFEKQHPGLGVSVNDMHGPEILRAMKNHEFELAFVGSPYVDTEVFDFIPITWELTGCIVPSVHPLAGEESISITQLKDERFYLMSPETGLYDYYRGMCLDNGFEPHVAGIRSREETVLTLVQHGGATLMPKDDFLNYAPPGLSFVPLKEEYWNGYVVIKLKKRKLSKNSKLLWDFFAGHK